MRPCPAPLRRALLLGLAGALALRPFAGAAALDLRAAPDAAPGPSILLYHRFASEANDSMTVRIATFEAHLAWLREHGYRIVPLRDIVAWLADPATTLPPKAVALTADDGHRSIYDAMRPIVLRERIPVTLFVYPSAISNASYAMTWSELRELRNTRLFDVQSHTWWHPNFNIERQRQAPAAFEQFASTQFVHSRELIERQLGGPVDMLAWPFGIYDDELMKLATRAGYRAAFTIEGRPVTHTARPLAIPRFLMADACTPAQLGRLLGEPSRAGARS